MSLKGADKTRWARNRNVRHRDLVRALKSRPCDDCGIQYPHYVMDFDHVRGDKSFNISDLYGKSEKAILAEVAKCDLVCANCHRIRTHVRSTKCA
jgi:hypothetical protein